MATIGVTFVVARVWVSLEVWKPIRVVDEYIRNHCDVLGAILNVMLVLGVVALLFTMANSSAE